MGVCTTKGTQAKKLGVHCCKQCEGFFSENIVQYVGCSRSDSSRSQPGDEDLNVSSLIERWTQEALRGKWGCEKRREENQHRVC